MQAKIFYFSGAGNSLALAKALKQRILADTELVSMADCRGEKSVAADAQLIGFVFPTYFHGMPSLVREFVRKLVIPGNPYAFAVSACNASVGYSLFALDKLLRAKGNKLAIGCQVLMPGVSVVDGYLTSAEVNAGRLANAERTIRTIAEKINARTVEPIQGENSVSRRIAGGAMRLMANAMLNPKLYYSTEHCVGCGQCSRICPNENIAMSAEQKPMWGKDCLHCMACLHWCPQEAIELGEHSVGKERFRHPHVSVEEMLVHQNK